jgi:outer membrane protein assembly factor BamB
MKINILPRLIVALLVTHFTVSASGADSNWPQFRGPGGAGGTSDGHLPERWSTGEHVAWKADIPGKGWSSPIVWGDRVFVTTVTSDAPGLEPRKGLYIQDLQGTIPMGTHHWQVLCLDLGSGKELWRKEAHSGKPSSTIHLKNSYASETPVTDGKHVYAYFGNVGLFCYDFEGELKWSRNWDPVETRLGWGTAASPALHDGRIYLVNDNEKESFLVSLDAATGKDLWRVKREERSNWATPFVWKNELRTEIVTAGTGKIRSYDLDGKVLWELGPMSTNAIPTPFAAHGLLFVTSGYVMDNKRPIYAIRPGAKRDISLKGDELSNEFIAWSLPQIGPYHPTPVVVGETLYVLYDRGLLAGFDAKTGKEVLARTRLGGATAFTASPWTAGGKLFCLNEDGDTLVVEPGSSLKVVAINRLDEMALATPAIAGDCLLIRTQTKIYCLK